MRTFSTHAPNLRGHRPRAIVLAVGDDAVGVRDAAEFLATVPELDCPVVVCAAPSSLERLNEQVGAAGALRCTDDRPLDDAPVWIVPEGHLATVDRDRWTLTNHPNVDFDAQVGRLCSSLKASYRSRVFMVCSGAVLDENPLVRLLVQRGARLVETHDRPDRGLADHASVAEIVAHLGASVGTIRKASA